MKLIITGENLYYLILPINLKDSNEDNIITKIKNIFLNYNHKYHLLDPGFYEVEVYNHHIIGTILKVEKIDAFDFSEGIDLKIIIKDKIKAYLSLIDPLDFPKFKSKIDIDTITYKDYVKLIEHSNIIIDTKKVLT